LNLEVYFSKWTSKLN